jgi:hypothetical protein
MRQATRNRRGITAVLAMLYMTLFSTLALGFYASVTTAVAVASNEQQSSRALLAAESGMAFIKYHLATLSVPANTPQDQLFTTVYSQVKSKLEGSATMQVQLPDKTWVAGQVVMNTAQDTVTIPHTSAIRCNSTGTKFRIVLTKQAGGQQIRVKVSGIFDNGTKIVTAGRATQLDYAVAKDAAKIFNYGVASKSAIGMSGNVTVQGAPGNESFGSILSATTSTNTPLTMSGNAKISGDASFVLSNPTLSLGSACTIAGYKPANELFDDHIHTNVGNVPFPLIDTAVFMPYVPATTATGAQVINTATPSGTYFKNIRIKAGANPSFAAGTTIEGVVVVESPNKVKFSGQVNLTGCIVSETPNPTTDPNNASYSLTSNTVEFAGGVDYQPINMLPATTDFPPELRALTGTMVLMPGFDVAFGGNFETIEGSIIASKISFSGTAGGTIVGSVINLRDSSLSIAGNSTITIQSVGTSNYPAGVFFGSHYAPLPSTYVEAAQ